MFRMKRLLATILVFLAVGALAVGCGSSSDGGGSTKPGVTNPSTGTSGSTGGSTGPGFSARTTVIQSQLMPKAVFIYQPAKGAAVPLQVPLAGSPSSVAVATFTPTGSSTSVTRVYVTQPVERSIGWFDVGWDQAGNAYVPGSVSYIDVSTATVSSPALMSQLGFLSIFMVVLDPILQMAIFPMGVTPDAATHRLYVPSLICTLELNMDTNAFLQSHVGIDILGAGASGMPAFDLGAVDCKVVNGDLFVANLITGTVSQFNLSTGLMTRSVPVQMLPIRLAVDTTPARNVVVAEMGGGFSVIAPSGSVTSVATSGIVPVDVECYKHGTADVIAVAHLVSGDIELFDAGTLLSTGVIQPTNFNAMVSGMTGTSMTSMINTILSQFTSGANLGSVGALIQGLLNMFFGTSGGVLGGIFQSIFGMGLPMVGLEAICYSASLGSTGVPYLGATDGLFGSANVLDPGTGNVVWSYGSLTAVMSSTSTSSIPFPLLVDLKLFP